MEPAKKKEKKKRKKKRIKEKEKEEKEKNGMGGDRARASHLIFTSVLLYLIAITWVAVCVTKKQNGGDFFGQNANLNFAGNATPQNRASPGGFRRPAHAPPASGGNHTRRVCTDGPLQYHANESEFKTDAPHEKK